MTQNIDSGPLNATRVSCSQKYKNRYARVTYQGDTLQLSKGKMDNAILLIETVYHEK